MAPSPATEAPSTPILGSFNPDGELQAIRAEQAPAPVGGNNPMAAEEYAFTIERIRVDGSRISGSFKNKILSIQERIELGLLAARATRGAAWSSLDDDTQYLVNLVAHLTVSLLEKPIWFKIAEIKDTVFINKVFAEVSKHEAFFRGSGAAQAASNGAA